MKQIDPKSPQGDRVLELVEKGIDWDAIALRVGIQRRAIPNFLADAKRRRAKRMDERAGVA